MSSLLRRKNLKDCCRTCLNDLSNKMHGLFDERDDSPTAAEILSLFTNLKVQSEDMLPKNLCNSCFNCLVNFYDFKILAEKVDLQLSQYYENLLATDKIEVQDSLATSVKNEIIEFDDNDSFKLEIKNEDSSESIENCISNILELSYPELKLQTEKSKKSSNSSKRKAYECPHCKQIFKFKGKYNKHLLTHDKEYPDAESVKCDICSAHFKSAQSLAAHKRIHVPRGRVLACQYCGKVFKKTSHLKRHEGSHYINRTYKCMLCPKAYHTDSGLKEHMHKHTGIKPHPCPICPKGFAHLSTLNNHLKLHMRGKAYLCPTCGKGFDSNTNLSQHVRRHLGLKAFACSLCPSKFVSKGELQSHEKTHTGEKAFACQHCESTFTKHNSLKKHALIHTGLKPYQCDSCPKKFTAKNYLRAHIRTHTGEKPFRCDLCERAFTQSGDLLKHKRMHLGVNLYKCDQCSQSFRLKSLLRDHMSDHFVAAKKAQSGDLTTEEKPDNVES